MVRCWQYQLGGGKTGKTIIGKLNTITNLYSYDQNGLERHCREHSALLPTANARVSTTREDIFAIGPDWKYIESGEDLVDDLRRATHSSASNATHDHDEGGWRAYVSIADEDARICLDWSIQALHLARRPPKRITAH